MSIEQKSGITDNSPHTLRTDLSCITYLFHGYDGRVFVHGNSRLIWHGIAIDERRLQLLPQMLQKHPERYKWLEKLLLKLYRRWRAK
jgi:hypothetical protein